MAALLMGLGLETDAAEGKGAAKGPEVRSAMALVIDSNSGEVIFERNVTSVVPIASITKLMTALVVLDGKQPLDEVDRDHGRRSLEGQGRAFAHPRRREDHARGSVAPRA